MGKIKPSLHAGIALNMPKISDKETIKYSKKTLKKAIKKASKELVKNNVKWEDLLKFGSECADTALGYYTFITGIYNKITEEKKVDSLKIRTYLGFIGCITDFIKRLENISKNIPRKSGKVTEQEMLNYINISMDYGNVLDEITKFGARTLLSVASKLDPDSSSLEEFKKFQETLVATAEDVVLVKDILNNANTLANDVLKDEVIKE